MSPYPEWFLRSEDGHGVFIVPPMKYDHICTLILAWKIDYIHYEAWDKITYAFSNFNGATVGVWEWMNNFIPHFTEHVITHAC